MTMASGIKCLGILLLLFLVFLSGALIFLKGFLLSRTVLETKSACEPEFAKTVSSTTHKHEVEGCWMHGRFKRAIIIVIDALRYDFLAHNASLENENDIPPFLNKFKSVDYLLTRKPMNSRLFKFRADPPTTTMQRLKGLTTGSLPTFVDVSSNFQSYEITEDNFLFQLNEAKKRITFLGDDTWLGLFPKAFKKSFDFPSFDVKDLHTVDDGILKHLYPEIRKRKWDVIIAHFLGVDHCGHRYGPNHPAMADKLSQMDNVISSVTNLMKNDTILFVMGDHGMTRTGDHGGDSEDELNAGMFIYSPSQFASSPQKTFDDTVVQTDLVPTLSLLLGIPIPFSNLGMVIPELFSHCPWWNTDSDVKKVFHKVKALRLNARQVDAYLDSYQQISSDLPRKELRRLTEIIRKSEKDLQSLMSVVASGKGGSDTLNRLVTLENTYVSYLASSRKMCENVWAKFDLKMIFAGITSMALGVVLAIYFVLVYSDEKEEDSSTLTGLIICGAILHLVYLTLHVCLLPESVPPVMVFVISLVLIFVCLVPAKVKIVSYFNQYCSFSNVAIVLIAILSCCTYFSNSFVVYEDKISLFLLQSLLFVLWVKIAVSNHSPKSETAKSFMGKSSKKSKSSFDILQYLTEPSLIALVVLFVCAVFLRLTSNFHACREEQHQCDDSFFLVPLSNLGDALRNQRYLLTILCLGAIVYLSRYWLKFYGNLNGSRVSVLCLSFAPPIGAVCACLHWALQTLPQATLDNMPKWQQVIMAQIVYACIIVSLITILLSPLLIYVQPSRQDPLNLSKGTIPSIYNQIKLQMAGDEEEKKPPSVYGLGSVYSASVIALGMTISLLLCLLLNDGLAPSMLCAFVSFYLILELFSASVMTDKKRADSEDRQYPIWHGMVLLSMFSTVFFYATGHQATIPNIRMEAAYTGFYGDFHSYILPGFLIWSNTFASHIFFGLVSPLLMFWPNLTSVLVQRMIKEHGAKHSQERGWKGDFSLFNDGNQFRKRLLQLLSGVILVCGLKMLLAACAATTHRRHLMVWKIFAPRFIYEAAMFVTTSVCLILAYLFALRVDTALAKFVKTLPSQREVTRD